MCRLGVFFPPMGGETAVFWGELKYEHNHVGKELLCVVFCCEIHFELIEIQTSGNLVLVSTLWSLVCGELPKPEYSYLCPKPCNFFMT